MKIQVTSDLHLERQGIDLQNAGADVLVLSGDIIGAKFIEDRTRYTECDSLVFNRVRSFFDSVSERFQHVVYVAGNHEFYGYKWRKTHTEIFRFLEDYTNIHYLNGGWKRIDDVVFVGHTLWTDMNKGDPLTLHAVRDMMNDFRVIRNDLLGYTPLKPHTTALEHMEALKFFRQVVQLDPKLKHVIVTHHSPSFQSVSHEYKDQYLLNGAYHSDLSEFILDHPQIKLWTHGHVHDPFDYHIGETRVVCNPMGYIGYESRAGKYRGDEKVVEI